jgi:hypothetical protein
MNKGFLLALGFYLFLSNGTYSHFDYFKQLDLIEASFWYSIFYFHKNFKTDLEKIVDKSKDPYWSRIYLYFSGQL